MLLKAFSDSFYSMHKVASLKEHTYRQVLTSYSWRIAQFSFLIDQSSQGKK